MGKTVGPQQGEGPGLGEDRVREELAHLKAIYRAAPVGLGFVDAGLRFVNVNDALATLDGVAAAEHIGRTVREVLPALAGEVEPGLRQVLETGTAISREVRLRGGAGSGGEQYHVVSYYPAVDADGRVGGVNVVIQDITTQKRAEAQLRSRVQQQAVVAALGTLALTSADVQTLMDEAVCRLAETLEVPYVELLTLLPDGDSLLLQAGVGWKEGSVGTVTVGAGPRSQAGFTLSANEPVVVSDLGAERRFAPPALLRDHGVVSGMTTVIAGPGRAYGVLGVHTGQAREFTGDDINLLRAVANVLAAAVKDRWSEQALRDSEARMRAIVTTLVDGVISIDERGTIDSVNAAAERLFGYAAGELTGRNVSVLMPEPYQGQHDGYIAHYLATGRAKIIGTGREVVGRKKDGTTFPMDLAVNELRVGGRRMFTGVARDITERRRLEREILEAGAEEQQRIGRDLHDGLCQHLAGIAFATEVLSQKLAARGAPETAGVAKVAELVDQAITQARDLARGLQPVALGGGLVSALEGLARQVEGLFHVACMFVCDGPCTVHDDGMATHLYRIVQEAISNAVRHGKARTIVIELSAANGVLHLSVKDDGVGLGKAPDDGNGMGLRTMEYRARMMGGALTVRPGGKGGTVVDCVIQSGSVEGKPAASEDYGKEENREGQDQDPGGG